MKFANHEWDLQTWDIHHLRLSSGVITTAELLQDTHQDHKAKPWEPTTDDCFIWISRPSYIN